MTSLVDRYVYTALRRVPQQQRSDIDRELRASIHDAVDARVQSGEPDASLWGLLMAMPQAPRQKKKGVLWVRRVVSPFRLSGERGWG